MRGNGTWRRRLLTLVVLALLVGLTVAGRALWLPWLAQWLVVEDTPHAADLIFVFAGDYEERGEHGAWLYAEQLAPRLLVTGEGFSRDIVFFCGQEVTKAELTARAAMDAGVPAEAIHVVRQGTSTYEEGEALKAFMAEHGYGSVIAVSSPYHMRRIRATLRHILRDTGIAVQYSPARRSAFRVERWWTRERELLWVSSEYLKLAYYYLVLL